MNIVFFGNASEKIAAIRYRVVRFAEMLQDEGHRCSICLRSTVWMDEVLYERFGFLGKLTFFVLVFLRRVYQLRHIPRADGVFLRGPIFPYGPPIFEYIIHYVFRRNIVFDIDDAIWEPPAYVQRWSVRWVDRGWVRKMAQRSRGAVVGNRYLEEYVRRCNPHLPIAVVPTCIDIRKHRAKVYPETPPKEVVLGWTGLKDNLGYLRSIGPVLQALAQRYPLRLLVASGAPFSLEGVPVEFRRWQLEHEIDYLCDADIGLMPLEDTPRARGKCAFKALQYMAVGVPVVISPVGMNAEVIEEGVNGFLAQTDDDWYTKLEQLIVDYDLRRRMGRAARETILQKFTHEVHYPSLRNLLQQAARGNGG